MSHPHGYHCLHIYGFDFATWCPECHKDFVHFVAANTADRPLATDDDKRAVLDLYRKYVDLSLAYVVLSEIERGELPAPVGFPTPESFGEKLRALAEPSQS
jgi:hypothetical protein